MNIKYFNLFIMTHHDSTTLVSWIFKRSNLILPHIKICNIFNAI